MTSKFSKPVEAVANWGEIDELLKGGEKARGTFDSEAFIRAIRNQVAGQDHFLDDLAKVLRTYLNAAKPRNKPKARFLFLGRSGTGKTELGKAVAKFVFPRRELLHIAMESLPKDIASATTYLFGSPGVYTNSARGLFAAELGDTPDRVVLLDEIDKAPPQIFSAFMALLDEGYTTDMHSKTKVDFTQSIVIMTCNAEAADYDALERIQEAPEPPATHQTNFRKYLGSNKFRPELLARIDRIFVFKRLDRLTVARVAVIKLQKRVEDSGMHLDAIDSAGVVRLTNMVMERMEGGLGGRAFDSVIDEEINQHLEEASTMLDGAEATIRIGRSGRRDVAA